MAIVTMLGGICAAPATTAPTRHGLFSTERAPAVGELTTGLHVRQLHCEPQQAKRAHARIVPTGKAAHLRQRASVHDVRRNLSVEAGSNAAVQPTVTQRGPRSKNSFAATASKSRNIQIACTERLDSITLTVHR